MKDRLFSISNGLIKPEDMVQRGRMDERLTNRLWTVLTGSALKSFNASFKYDNAAYILYYKLWDEFFGWQPEGVSEHGSNCEEKVRFWFLNATWDQKYNFMQYLVSIPDVDSDHNVWKEIRKRIDNFARRANVVLEQEGAVYRFVANVLTEVLDSREMEAIEAAASVKGPLGPAKAHISAALKLYSNRDNPDFRNSVKESISAVESAFFVINQRKSSSLTEAIKLAEKQGFALHQALRSGLISIYGWSSDEPGVRRGNMLEAVNVGSNEARLMLVLCSAFVNYLCARVEELSATQA